MPVNEIKRIVQAKEDLKSKLESAGIEVGDKRINEYAELIEPYDGSYEGNTIELETNIVKALAKSSFTSHLYYGKNYLTPLFEEMASNGDELILGNPEFETKYLFKTDKEHYSYGYVSSSQYDTFYNGGNYTFAWINSVKKLPKIILYVPNIRQSINNHYADYYVTGMFLNCPELEEVDIVIRTYTEEGFYNRAFTQGLFSNCSKLKKVKLELPSSSINCAYMFGYCNELETIEVSYNFASSTFPIRTKGLRILDEVGGNSVYNYASYMFQNCKNLKHVTFDTIYRTSLSIGYGTDYGHLLTIESLLSAIQACRSYTSKYTLTVGATNLEKLANVYVKITDETDTNFYPFEVCESTDEGAMDINTYMALKNWKIA
jgi:hypothetical protein